MPIRFEQKNPTLNSKEEKEKRETSLELQKQNVRKRQSSFKHKPGDACSVSAYFSLKPFGIGLVIIIDKFFFTTPHNTKKQENIEPSLFCACAELI